MSVLALFGSYRTKVAFDFIHRQPYAYAVLRAADDAQYWKIPLITVVELGVAQGNGLLSLCRIAEKTERTTGIHINVVGFDTVSGMPPARLSRSAGVYAEGDYPMNEKVLRAALPGNANLILGPLRDTVPEFVKSCPAPIGFVAIDLDYYSSTKEAMALFCAEPVMYLPCPVVYVDDLTHQHHNSYCGESLAIREFNAEHQFRKIEQYRFLRNLRILKNAFWLDQIYLFQVLDHPARNSRYPGRPIHSENNDYL